METHPDSVPTYGTLDTQVILTAMSIYTLLYKLGISKINQ